MLIVVAILMVALGAYALTFRAVSGLQEESFLLAEEITSAQTREARSQRAEEVLATISQQESLINSRLVTAGTLVDFLESVEDVEEGTGGVVTVVSVNAQEESGNFVINLTVEGSFGQVMQALGAIENLPVFITMREGAIDTIVRENADDGVWTASMSYRVGSRL